MALEGEGLEKSSGFYLIEHMLDRSEIFHVRAYHDVEARVWMMGVVVSRETAVRERSYRSRGSEARMKEIPIIMISSKGIVMYWLGSRLLLVVPLRKRSLLFKQVRNLWIWPRAIRQVFATRYAAIWIQLMDGI